MTTPFSPMLAAPHGRPSPGWWAQQKLDGHRRAITITGNKITGWSRKGTPADLPAPLVESLQCFTGTGWTITLDGELMADGTWWAFDLPVLRHGAGGGLTARSTQTDRLDRLQSTDQRMQPAPEDLFPAPNRTGRHAGRTRA